jgi:hypothetical protein
MTMTRRDTIAEAILASRTLFNRYLAGFDDSNHTKQGPHLPNHVAWCLGHCALTLHRGVERINHEPIPESDFYSPPADLAGRTPTPAPPPPPPPPTPAGTPSPGSGARAIRAGSAGHAAPTRFDTETVSFGSTPMDNAQMYPRFERCAAIFDAACVRYAAVIRSLPEERLDAMIQWGQIQIPVWASGLRMAFHNGTHSGQVADLRRALGMKSIFG